MRRAHVAGLVALSLAAGLPASAPAPAAAAAAQRTVSISGSETAGALVADLIYYYRRSTPSPPRFVLTEGGTAAGVADAFRGISAIGLAARDRQPSDPAALVFTPVAVSGVCVVTNPRNPLRGITREQLGAIAAGRLTTWAQVPGATVAGRIETYGYPIGEGAQDVFESSFLDPANPRLFPGLVRLQTGSELRRAILGGPARAGWIDSAYTDGLHVVPVDGVTCDHRTIAGGAYPARRGLNFVTRGRPTGAAARFIRWTRTSRRARSVVDARYVAPR